MYNTCVCASRRRFPASISGCRVALRLLKRPLPCLSTPENLCVWEIVACVGLVGCARWHMLSYRASSELYAAGHNCWLNMVRACGCLPRDVTICVHPFVLAEPCDSENEGAANEEVRGTVCECIAESMDDSSACMYLYGHQCRQRAEKIELSSACAATSRLFRSVAVYCVCVIMSCPFFGFARFAGEIAHVRTPLSTCVMHWTSHKHILYKFGFGAYIASA